MNNISKVESDDIIRETRKISSLKSHVRLLSFDTSTMLAAIRSALFGSSSTRPDPAEYQPVIPSNAVNADPADPATLDHIDRQLGHGAARDVIEYENVKVYFCFWVLGAGVLMSWNGELRCIQYWLSYANVII